MSKVKKPKPIRTWCLAHGRELRPAYCHPRRWMVKEDAVHNVGLSEDWEGLVKEGFRVVRVTITPVRRKK